MKVTPTHYIILFRNLSIFVQIFKGFRFCFLHSKISDIVHVFLMSSSIQIRSLILGKSGHRIKRSFGIFYAGNFSIRNKFCLFLAQILAVNPPSLPMHVTIESVDFFLLKAFLYLRFLTYLLDFSRSYLDQPPALQLK